MNDIYNDKSYISKHPDLHREDSAYKFEQISRLLEMVHVESNKIKILDIGGGAGVLGRLVAEYFRLREKEVEFVALDVSADMLEIQAKENPHLVRSLNCSILDCPEEKFDIVLMIDVIEHVPDKELVAGRLNKISRQIIYNIPIEINLMDFARNLRHRGQHYPEQTRAIGHIHFFTYASALKFVDRHHCRRSSFFKAYCSLLKDSPHPRYQELRRSRLRLAEVKLSCWIDKYLTGFAPWIVQGSLFALVQTQNYKV